MLKAYIFKITQFRKQCITENVKLVSFLGKSGIFFFGKTAFLYDFSYFRPKKQEFLWLYT